MKYSDFISLQDYFHPVFNLQNEGNDGYWKQFIPTKQFYELLEKTMDSVSSNLPAKRKSIWVKGTFGTGKSHAGAVIKHLLCNKLEDVTDYIEEQIQQAETKSRLLGLRKEQHLFPVVLKGTEDGKIHSMRSFSLTLERTVKESLRKAGHNITVQSNYERAIDYLENTPFDINAIISKEPKLRGLVKTEEDLIKKLRVSDTDVYLAMDEAFSKEEYSIYIGVKDLVEWLSEVEKEVVEKGIASGLLIMWDEFTSVMDTISSGMTNMIQNLAELTETQNIYLYLISHRNANTYSDSDVSKMEDRFHKVQYNMESITTYRIMSASIRKTDEQQYDLCRDARMEQHKKLISYLTENEPQATRDIKNLFPIHPYAAFLCSSIANQVGSANRTVMQFMYEEESGFVAFLKDKEAANKKSMLTADRLWDYFLKEFTDKDTNGKFGIVTQTYFDKKTAVAAMGVPYEKVFKGILLLNAMRQIVENADKIMPSTQNIIYLFEGEDFASQTEEILNQFDTNQIIQRDPAGNFLLAFASLPQNEINEAVKRSESNFSDVIKIIGYDKFQNEPSIKSILEDSLLRQPVFALLSCSYDDYKIKSHVKSAFQDPYTLNIVLFFAMDIAERNKMQERLEELASTDDYKNVVFVLFDEVFENNGRQRSRFHYYVANADVARSHNSREQQQVNEKNAKDYINQFIAGLKQGTARVYFRQEKETKNAKDLAKHINENITTKIFGSGVETLTPLRKAPMTFWKIFQSPSKASIEPMLFASSREDAEQKFRAVYTPAKQLFKDENDDYIVESDLKLKNDAPEHHPLVLVQKKVDEIFNKIKKENRSTFNLATELQVLTRPPFGLYCNIPNMAVLSFAMRKYINELNGVDLGTPIDDNNMRDRIVDIFSSWSKGGSNSKLNVRFGSKDEKELKDLLINIFDMKNLSDAPELTSLKNVRWGVDAYCKQKSKLPLWCLKYAACAKTDEFKSLIEQLVELVQKEETKEDVVKKVLAALKQQQYELTRILAEPHATEFEDGFKAFVKKIKDVTIKNEWWDELKEYLSQQLPPEIGFWQESDVENTILRFSIKKNTIPSEEEGEKKTNDNPAKRLTLPIPLPADEGMVQKAKKKIKKAKNDSPIVLKQILLEILDRYPQTAEIIDDNLDD